MTMSSGWLERSPIMSCRTWVNSTSRAGSDLRMRARTSAMISSMGRSRFVFRRTVKSPRLASVTAARPSCRPVRREVMLDLGGAVENLLDVGEHAVGLGERAAGRHEVVEDEGAFVHLGQEIGAEGLVAEVGADDERRGRRGRGRVGAARDQLRTRSCALRMRRMMGPFSMAVRGERLGGCLRVCGGRRARGRASR